MNLMHKNRSNSEQGQVLLIALLIMVVGLTVGLAVIARSITNIKISTQNEESQRAFSAAEAGLEVALLSGTGGSSVIGSANYLVTAVEENPPNNIFVFPSMVKQDETRNLWLVTHDASGDLEEDVGNTDRYKASAIDVCWKEKSTVPAMEIILLYKESGNTYKVARGGYDPADPPAASSRRNSNKFSDVTNDGGGNCGDFTYRKRITFNSAPPDGFNVDPGKVLIALRLRPIYADTEIAVQGAGGVGGILPPQGKIFRSTGTAGATARKVQVFKSYPSFPPIFDFVMFSGTDLNKTP